MEQRRKGDDGRKESEVVSEGNWETERRTPKDFMGESPFLIAALALFPQDTSVTCTSNKTLPLVHMWSVSR